ncbi:hypothetical protein CMUS01_06818 [Colletotrichum musicola]|uniref:Uncharacterized protein n=1 Tax=Colletotrichum musicola TaxID=2175873 RepID=A0A8H6NGH6_9PEZI|nr:hypothetical protein CMUS01_06818 [Colletotrichum musicola]
MAPPFAHSTIPMELHQQILFCLSGLSSFARAQVQSANEIQKLLEDNKINSTALSQLKPASSVNSPTVRGSVEILWTCLVTLVACVYTVLHLNIPSKTGRWASFLDKLRWVCIAIMLPEIVVHLGSQQLLQATGLRKELQEWLVTNNEDTTLQIDLEFSFFVAMGGCQISAEDEGIKPGPAFESNKSLPHPFILRLSPLGFLRLVKLGEIDLKKVLKATYIDDRSKANCRNSCNGTGHGPRPLRPRINRISRDAVT